MCLSWSLCDVAGIALAGTNVLGSAVPVAVLCDSTISGPSGPSALGKFPVLEDDGSEIFEATAIIEHLDVHHPGDKPLIPRDEADSIHERMIDRVFDNYVMHPVQEIVAAHIRSPGMPDPQVEGRARAMLDKSYAWLDEWLQRAGTRERIGLIECVAAP